MLLPYAALLLQVGNLGAWSLHFSVIIAPFHAVRLLCLWPLTKFFI